MRQLLALACALLLATPAMPQSSAPPPGGYGVPITVAKAMAIIHRGMDLGQAKGFKLAFAVVEPSGELVAFARTEDAPYASGRLAQQKARTAARLRLPTAVLEERVLGGRTVLLSSDEVIAIGGGVPIIENGLVIGALGVSGATAAEDAQIAGATLGAH
jgi:glc operon protein GlcG